MFRNEVVDILMAIVVLAGQGKKKSVFSIYKVRLSIDNCEISKSAGKSFLAIKPPVILAIFSMVYLIIFRRTP
jgi:hypothetical protein